MSLDGVDDVHEDPWLPPREETELPHEDTKVEAAIHEPIIHTVRSLRRQAWCALGLNALVLLAIGWLLYYQTVTMGGWRQQGRDIQLEILERVRARGSVVR